MNAQEYRCEHEKLMQEWENRVRRWLADMGCGEIAETVPFYRDGVTCPEVWFQRGNNFRPMFVLKEVSTGVNTVGQLSKYLEEWAYQKRFEFAQNPFDDIRVGTFRQWRRIARLAKALEDAYDGIPENRYEKYDLRFKEGGDVYEGDVLGYKKELNCKRTANEVYNSIVNNMAVLEIKKVGGGQTVGSKLSLAGRYYTEHIKPFEDLICRQIELINPTVIVCLGRENGECISQLLKNVKAATKERIWIDGYHHARSSNINFYDEPTKEYRNQLENRR